MSTGDALLYLTGGKRSRGPQRYHSVLCSKDGGNDEDQVVLIRAHAVDTSSTTGLKDLTGTGNSDQMLRPVIPVLTSVVATGSDDHFDVVGICWSERWRRGAVREG